MISKGMAEEALGLREDKVVKISIMITTLLLQRSNLWAVLLLALGKPLETLGTRVDDILRYIEMHTKNYLCISVASTSTGRIQYVVGRNSEHE